MSTSFILEEEPVSMNVKNRRIYIYIYIFFFLRRKIEEYKGREIKKKKPVVQYLRNIITKLRNCP